VVLSGDFKVQVNASDIGGVSGNGLIYTGSSSPFNSNYQLDIQFGVTLWTSATCNSANTRMNITNIFATRKMFLPTYSEMQANGTSSECGSTGNIGGTGVPNLNNWTWMTTANSTWVDNNSYILWHTTSTILNTAYYASYKVRCIR
jgi:hypothetical protein